MLEIQKLIEELSFNFYKSQRQVSQYYTHNVLKEYNITYPQLLVLKVLWDKGPVTVSDIVNALALDTGTISPLLKRMQKLNLIKRDRSETDQRIVMVNLTKKGLELKENLSNAFSTIQDTLDLDIQELKELNLLLSKVIESLNVTKSFKKGSWIGGILWMNQ